MEEKERGDENSSVNVSVKLFSSSNFTLKNLNHICQSMYQTQVQTQVMNIANLFV